MEPIWIISAVAFFIVMLIVLVYNGIIGNNNMVTRAWSDVLVHERQKIKTLDALKAEAESYKNFEEGLLTKITQLRAQVANIGDKAEQGVISDVQRATHELMSGLKIAVEAYPELNASKVISNLMREIVEQQDNVAAALKIFNGSVETFNNSIQMFPGSLINAALNKMQPKTPFNDSNIDSDLNSK